MGRVERHPARRYQRLSRPLLLGHRGLNTVAPENTLEAIEAAADIGVDGVEVDLRLSADGEVMVFHDSNLYRLLERPARIEAMTRAELAEVDLGGGAGIPTLDAVLDLCAARGLLLNLELKRDVPDRRLLVTRVVEQLARWGWGQLPALVVSSFDPLMLAGFRWRAPAFPVAVLYEGEHLWVRHAAGPLGAAALHPPAARITSDLVRHHHQRGRRVMVWTVNAPDAAHRLLTLGVDGIMTDDPAALLPLFR